MQKWKYVLVVASTGLGGGIRLYDGKQSKKLAGKGENELIQILNQLGAAGWEVVNGTYQMNNAAVVVEKYLLKREVSKTS